jgi:lysophospholipase L1-like esterase
MTWVDRHPWITGAIVGSVLLASLLALAEAYLRFKNPPALYTADREIGWVAKKNYQGVFRQMSLDGSYYASAVQTNSLGLRSFRTGEDGLASKVILVLGDSHTMEPYASDSEMWWAVFAKQLALNLQQPLGEVKVWAGGAGGYGTLQNLLLVRRLKANNLPRPDLFILQFCGNDYVNNHRGWEATTMVHNQKFSRPYYDPDGVVRFSDHWLAPIWRSALLQQSRLFSYSDTRLQGIFYKIFADRIVNLPSAEVVAKFDQESLWITSELLKALRQELPETPAIMVNCDPRIEGLNAQWTRLARDAGFLPMEKPAQAIFKDQNKRGALLHADGAHLSIEGNKLFGQSLSEEFLNNANLLDFRPLNFRQDK